MIDFTKPIFLSDGVEMIYMTDYDNFCLDYPHTIFNWLDDRKENGSWKRGFYCNDMGDIQYSEDLKVSNG